MSGPEVLQPYNGGNESRAREFEPGLFNNTIIALDVDGVLVKPVAYRQVVRSTISFFAEQTGVNPEEFSIDDRNKTPGRSMTHFEAEGIHDPWDVSAIIVALMKLKKAGVNVSNAQALEAFKINSGPQSHPPEVILEWIIKTFPQVTVKDMQGIRTTLSKTRDQFKNEVTGIFQEYVLGKNTFEETYGRPSRTGAEESLITTKDQVLLEDNGRKEVEGISSLGGRVVIYTGRPGLPPPDAPRKKADGYAPEAELAVAKSRINAIGIVSMGSMEWLAREINRLARFTGEKLRISTEDLTKPNPTQAMATILSALRGKTDMQVLIDAYKWARANETPAEIRPFIGRRPKLKLVVIEDAPSGVRAFINARDILKEEGVNVGLTAIGVHGGSFEKWKAFQRLRPEVDVIDPNSDIAEGIIRYSYQIRGKSETGDLGQRAVS